MKTLTLAECMNIYGGCYIYILLLLHESVKVEMLCYYQMNG